MGCGEEGVEGGDDRGAQGITVGGVLDYCSGSVCQCEVWEWRDEGGERGVVLIDDGYPG